MAVDVANKPSLIEHAHFRFLIIDAPTNANLEAYVKSFATHNVTVLVRACESHYDTDLVLAQGVVVHDVCFSDGSAPPEDKVTQWIDICARTFAKNNPHRNTIAVHCVAGLGRAPVLVAIALIESGLEPLEAILVIRAVRRGAINARQLAWLELSYKRRKKSVCAIM